MTRDGVDYIVKKYFRLAFPNSEEQVHPHVFRHSKASHLLASGVPIVYIRDFLGHADLETTMI
jgi:site-specific recombinase XerD